MFEALDFGPATPDHDPGPGGVDHHLDLFAGPLDVDAGYPGVIEPGLDVTADALVLDHVAAEGFLVGVPARAPVLDYPDPQPDWIDLVAHLARLKLILAIAEDDGYV